MWLLPTSLTSFHAMQPLYTEPRKLFWDPVAPSQGLSSCFCSSAPPRRSPAPSLTSLPPLLKR